MALVVAAGDDEDAAARADDGNGDADAEDNEASIALRTCSIFPLGIRA